MFGKGGNNVEYNVAVCDDFEADWKYVSALVKKWAAHTGNTVKITLFSSAENFLFHYAEKKDYDILLLDIEMGEMDGVSMAKRLRPENKSIQIVFITGFADYMAEGYEVSALHYLMKPVKGEKLFQVLDRAAEGLARKEKVLLFTVDGEKMRLPAERIWYVEALSHMVNIVTAEDTIPVKMSISEMEKLVGEGFIRCHRSYIVGLKHIARLSKTEVILDDGRMVPLSRGAAPSVHKAFISYYKGETDETF